MVGKHKETWLPETEFFFIQSQFRKPAILGNIKMQTKLCGVYCYFILSVYSYSSVITERAFIIFTVVQVYHNSNSIYVVLFTKWTKCSSVD